jgi:hypothetical protein
MPKILTVSDIKGNFYGGLPYNVTWDFNDGSSPSTLSVSVINENGQYPNLDNELTFLNTATVSIGNFVFNGYLTSYDISKSPDQKILTLKYVDKSADLERWYVGLYNRHGKLTGDAKNLIIVGKEYHPCDKNLDSTLDFSETDAVIIDPCDPCPNTPENKYDKTCDQSLSDFKIFEVYYTFNDLLQQLSKVVQFEQPSNVNKKFRAQHYGKLKDVLSSWCSDLGLAYYWDPVTSKLFFVDRKKPLRIPNANTLEGLPNVIDLQYGASKQSTFSRGLLGYFAKDGLVKDYTCELDERQGFIVLNCLTMSDLLDPDVYGETNDAGIEFIKLKELEAALSYYGRSVRDAFIWFYYYTVLNAAKANEYKIIKGENGREAPDQQNKIMSQFGNLKVLDVYSAQINGANFTSCKRKMSKEDLKSLKEFDKKNNRTEQNPSYYFFVAEVNEELAEKQFSDSEYMAKNFLGKFWHKKFNTPIPGATNSKSQINAESPDGSVQWYPARQDLNGLEIFNFGHQSGSMIANLQNGLKADEASNQDPFTQANGGDQEKKIRSNSSFLLLNRDAKWSPTGDDLKYYDSLFKWYEEHLPKAFGNTEGRPKFLFRLYPEAKNNTNIKLFFARELDNFEVGISTSDHPLDTPSQTDKTKTIERTDGTSQTQSIGKYGLKSNKCVKIKLPGMEIFTPSQCLSNIVGGYDDGDAGYEVYIQASASFSKVIPKLQYTITKDISNIDVAQLDYNFKEIREDNMGLVRGVSQKCIISQGDVKTYVESIVENCAYEMAEVQRTASFKVAGLMPITQYGVADGLSSVQITVSDNGVYTSYTFEDKVVQPPSEDYFMQNLIDKTRAIGGLNGNMPTTNEINFLKDSGI